MRLLTLVVFVVSIELSGSQPAALIRTRAALRAAEETRLQAMYGSQFQPQIYRSTAAYSGQQTYVIRRQGNASDCDFITDSNGVHNTGGDGEAAYWRVQALVPQEPRDYKEGFYTLQGSNGSAIFYQ